MDDNEKIEAYRSSRPVPLTPAQRSMRASKASNTRWANADPAVESERARARQFSIFEKRVDPDGTMDPAERERRAAQARKAHFQGLALISSKARAERAAIKRLNKRTTLR